MGLRLRWGPLLSIACVLSACSVYDESLIGRRDAATPDAQSDGAADDAGELGCVPSTQEFCDEICPETCNNEDDDCDTRVDESDGRALCTLANANATCVDGECVVIACTGGSADCDGLADNGCEARLDSPLHCGICNRACNFPGASALCTQDTCVFDACLPGFGNCDGLPGNGCELRVDSLEHCGGCSVACGDVVNGQPGCIDGMCGVAECDAGFGDCDNDATNGCETPLDVLSTCGSCEVSCAYDHATPICAEQTCVPGACLPGFGDCDGEPSNECEVTLATNPSHCGACGRACDVGGNSGSMYRCTDGECVVTNCPSGLADCDSDANNGCEVPLNTLTDCGGCDVRCAFTNGSASCATGTCAFVECLPGFGNCDGMLSNGCETNLNTDNNCGACNMACGPNRSCGGGSCSSLTCPSGSADCDQDDVSCEQSLNTLQHCGACGASCGDGSGRLSNATATCGSGSCAIGLCDATFANCDNSAGNGCETSLRTTANCGACGSTCSRTNATVSCATGACAIATCNSGFANCDGNANNGCETSTSTNQNCGACGSTCAQANAQTSCSSGTCVRTACDSGFGDCDNNPANGCETSLNSLTHCGACNTACALANAGETCGGGTCTLGSCDTGFGNCDFSASNGCETPLNTNGNCNACSALCDYANATESCSTRTCTLGACTSGYGNCDNVEGNGCEQSLNVDAHCGACGNACGAGQRCDNMQCVQGFPYTTTNFNGNDMGIVPAASATFNCGVSIFNSTTLAFTNWCGQPMPAPVVRSQGGGPDVVILAFNAFTVSSGATLQLVGNRPVIVASFGNATVAGTIDASGSGTTPGAGGNWSCGSSNGGNGGGSCNGGGGGGGGAGFATAGAQGGDSGARGSAGAARGIGALSPIFGGCAGGNGGGCSTTVGGGGGGAIQISAAGTLTLAATGRLFVNGAGGLGGGCSCSESGGGGGGSGGAILLEGTNVITTSGASITGNGGKGGTGRGGPAGGNGGTGTSGPLVGGNSANGAGGGGGAVGRGLIRGISSCSLAHSSSISLSRAGVCP